MVNEKLRRRKALTEQVTTRLREATAAIFQADPTDPKALREIRALARGAVGRLDSLIDLAEAPADAPKDS